MKTLAIILLLFCCVHGMTQFVERSDDLNLELKGGWAFFGSGTSFYDFNEDGLDDITVCSTDSGAQIFENAGDHFVERYYFADLHGELKHAVWVDYDNDGDNDFFVTRMNNKPYLMRNDGNFTFSDVSSALPCPDDAPFSTCCSWGDYDNDSFLDLYVVNYYFYEGLVSWLFHNNGDGTFDEVATEMNMDNGINPGFQSMWMDYNLDGDLDLMVLNDKYHGCKLYDNDGNGTFTDIGEQTNFDRLADNMGIAPSDFDHDGDFDFYITITEGNLLLRNDNGIFTDVGEEMNVDTHCTSWSCQFIDSDNQTWEDLYVLSTSECNSTINFFYENDHGLNFIEHDDMFLEDDEARAYSASKGDWNNDGRYDIIVSDGPITAMKLFENQNPASNFIKFDLTGTISNRDGVGAIVRCYANGTCLLRAHTCGYNFMSQDSQNIIIGIGDTSMVDSLSIAWPSGWSDVYYNLSSNAMYHFTEGETFQNEMVVNTFFCTEDTLQLQAPEGHSHMWNTGATLSEISITQPGIYVVDYITPFDWEQHIEFVADTFPHTEIHYAVQEPRCANSGDGSILIEEENLQSILWENDSTHFMRQQLDEGIYDCMIVDQHGCSMIRTFHIEAPAPLEFSATEDTICFGTALALQWATFGGVGNLHADWHGAIPDTLFAGEYTVTITDSNDCILTDTITVHSFPEIVFTYQHDTICSGETLPLQYEIVGVGEDAILVWSENPDSLSAGQHEVTITDSHGCSSTSQIVIDESSLMEITADVSHAIDDTNGSITLSVAGGIAPYQFIWNDGSTNNPIEHIGQGIYSVEIYDAANCVAFMNDIELIDTEVHEKKSEAFILSNPFHDELIIRNKSNHDLVIYDAFGKCVLTTLITSHVFRIDTSAWSCGVYFIRCDEIICTTIRE